MILITKPKAHAALPKLPGSLLSVCLYPPAPPRGPTRPRPSRRVTGSEAEEIVKPAGREAAESCRLAGGMADEEEDPTVSDHHRSNPLFSSLPGGQKRSPSSESFGIFLSEFTLESSGTSRRASLSLRIHLLVRGAGR